jgi:hypothetical protein
VLLHVAFGHSAHTKTTLKLSIYRKSPEKRLKASLCFEDAFASFRALIFCRLFLAALRFFFTAFLHAARNSESSCYGGENADDNLYQRFPCFSFHHDFPFFLVVKYLFFVF